MMGQQVYNLDGKELHDEHPLGGKIFRQGEEAMTANNDKKQSFWTTLPGILTGCAGLITAITGLIGACYASGLLAGPTPTTPPPTAVSIAPTETPQPISASTNVITLVAPNPATTTDLSVPEGESGCPYDERMGWLVYRDTWYGPWDGYWIQYDVNYFYVYDPNLWNASLGTYGLQTPYSTQFARNAWTELLASPFWVCIDIPGNVYVVYVQ